ncbi:MAG: hypothetical protein K9H65_03330 [Bacteroidales bacterium]|nr:hypothetical protein [Bacteroidales bacterium]
MHDLLILKAIWKNFTGEAKIKYHKQGGSMTTAKDKNIFFHVGLPKTASTFLQRNVFPKFNDIRFIKKHDFKHRDRIIEQSNHDKILMSIEINPDVQDGMEKLQDVSHKYPHTHTVIILRRHGSWLKSKYKYYLRKHGTRKFDRYFDLNATGILEPNNLKFYPKIKLLEDLFEPDPLVLFQEELKQNPLATIEVLADYMGVTFDKNDLRIQTVKRSYTPKQLKKVRRFNRWYQYDHSHITSKTKKFIYKKFSGLLLHSVAFMGAIIPDKSKDEETLITQQKIEAVNKAYREDWEKCLEYARQQRKLLFKT